MPYRTIAELPAQFEKLPDGAKEIAMNVVNSALDRGADEESAFKQAWGAIKKSYRQEADGSWVKLEEDDLALETVSLDNVEILGTGRWVGSAGPVTYKKTDLDGIVKAFNVLSGDNSLNYEPPIKLGHDDGQKMLQKDGFPAAGWVRSLKRVGDKLVASFGDVPKKIGDIVKAGGYKKVSSEIYHDYSQGGHKFPFVLKAVALLGGDIPAVKSISDIQAQYSEEDGIIIIESRFGEDVTSMADLYSGLDAWLVQAEATIKGKVGSPAIRTFVKEVKARLKALLEKEGKNEESQNSEDAELAELTGAWEDELAEWDTAYINDLPDSAFAFIRPGGEKDEQGKTEPRALRFLPFKNAQGGIDMPHLRAALSRLVQTKLTPAEQGKARTVLVAAAKKAGVGEHIESELREEVMLEELRKLYGLAEDAPESEVLEAVTKSKSAAEAKGQTVSLSEYEDQKGKVQTLQERIDLKERDERVTKALQAGKISPAMKEWADKYALDNPQGFDSFVEAQPVVVKLNEVGGDLQPGDVGELSESEVKVAALVGNTAEELLEDKKDQLNSQGVS